MSVLKISFMPGGIVNYLATKVKCNPKDRAEDSTL